MITGTITALITPFKNNGAIDFVALERIIRLQIEGGVNGILVAGSTGEGLLLTDEERESLVNFAREVIDRRVLLIVGSSCVSTRNAVKQAIQAEKLKANAVLSIVPFYVKPKQDGIIQHFIDIHDNSNIPIILYNNPSRCSVSISVDSAIEVFKRARVVAMKDSDCDLTRVGKLKEARPDIALLSGDDPSLLGYLSSGGDGTVSVISNVVPGIVSAMVGTWRKGDESKSRVLDAMLRPLNNVLSMEPNPIPVKYALHKKGLIENELRKPLTRASAGLSRAIDLNLIDDSAQAA
ncbi:MAG: 4-hydroxy-tetrahydrodipicolinate synthase [Holosporales bacterium]|jgi:4-hydroxy-tetrahydrodipicolinate synthase|nr:4-hydroxy-tetrahydrodipicolinate synthase [Holosporales bacterium]